MAEEKKELKITDPKEILAVERFRNRQKFKKKIETYMNWLLIMALVAGTWYCSTNYHKQKAETSSEGLYYMGMDKKKEYNYKEARTYFTKLVRDHPDDSLVDLANNEMKDIEQEKLDSYKILESSIKEPNRIVQDKINLCDEYITRYQGEFKDENIEKVKKYLAEMSEELGRRVWRKFPFNKFRISLLCPPTWSYVENETNRLRGSDGYIFLEERDIGIKGLKFLVTKEIEANPVLYGEKPTFDSIDLEIPRLLLGIEGFNIPETYIISSSKGLSEACAVIRYPDSIAEKTGKCILIHSTVQYIKSLVYGVSF